jgi:membrane protein DedA with SNARE-associated domain
MLLSPFFSFVKDGASGDVCCCCTSLWRFCVGDILGQLGEWIQQVIEVLGYPGIVLVMAAENVFPPIPSELVMPLAGFMARAGTFNLYLVIVAGMLGSVLGALVLYWLGAWANEAVIRRFLRRWGRYAFISENDLDVSLGYFHRHGEAVIFFGRLIPIVRSLISIPAGMDRMPLPKFLLYTTLGTTIWSAILTWAGWILQSRWEDVAAYIEQYQRIVLVLLAIAIGVFVYLRVVKPFVNRQAMARRR